MTRLLGIECAGGRPPPEKALYLIAASSASFLAPEEARPFWQKIGQAPCANRYDSAGRAWIALFAAVSERDAMRMADLGESIFRQHNPSSADHRRYALSAALIGRLALGQRRAAELLWAEFKDEFANTDDMLAVLLRSHLRPVSGSVRPTAAAR